MRPFPLKVGRIVEVILADGRRRPAKVTGNIVGSTANLKLADGSTRVSTVAWTAKPQNNVWRRP